MLVALGMLGALFIPIGTALAADRNQPDPAVQAMWRDVLSALSRADREERQAQQMLAGAAPQLGDDGAQALDLLRQSEEQVNLAVAILPDARAAEQITPLVREAQTALDAAVAKINVAPSASGGVGALLDNASRDISTALQTLDQISQSE